MNVKEKKPKPRKNIPDFATTKKHISKKLYEFKDSKEINSDEGTTLINEYRSALADQYSQAFAEAAEVPYAETPIVETIHLSLKI